MKKFFSAILLMTMMVFSVGTFVSCNDLVNEIEDVKGQTTEQAAAIKALENEIAALETALATAQKAADDAKAAANDAKAAAAQAKADAIADAKAQVEALKTALETAIAEKADKAEVDAMAKDVEAALAVINTSIAKLAEKDAMLDGQIAELLQADAALKAQIEALQAYGKDSSDSLVVELSALQNELDQLWQTIGSETGLQALVGTQAGLIEDLQAELQGLAESIFGEGAESLYTLVGQNAGAIQELLDKMDKVNADIEAINEALSIYSTLIIDLAGQIQSLVFVPTTSSQTQYNYIRTYEYSLGTDEDAFKTPVMFVATYEVTPKELVSKLSDQNVYFTSVATKVAPGFEMEAQIIDRDVTTGRIEVRGFAERGSDAYRILTQNFKTPVDPMSDYNGLAIALNIADSKPQVLPDEDHTVVDPGTYVSSAYTQVYYYGNVDLLDESVAHFVFPTVYGYDYNYINYNNTVAWNTPIAQSKVNLFPELKVYIEDQYMTLAQASKYLGCDLKLTFDKELVSVSNTGTYKKADGTWTKSPILISGEGLAMTAELQATDDFKNEAAAGEQAVVELKNESFKINGTVIPYLYAQSWYRITDKKSDIVISPVTKNWVYTDGDYAVIPVQELAVTSSEVADVTTLFGTNATYAFAAKDLAGNIVATADVTFLSSKTVRLSNVNAAYAQGKPVTYHFTCEAYDPAKKIDYTASFDLTLGAMPADKKITLDPITTTGFLTHGFEYKNINPIALALAKDAAYFGNITLGDLQKNGTFVAGEEVVKVNGTPNNDAAELTAKFGLAEDKETVIEDSKITFAKAEANTDSYVISQKYIICGVEYEFIANVQLKAPVYTLTYNPVYVGNDGVAELTGTVSTWPGMVNNTFKSTMFTLPAVNLRNYVNVTGESADDIQSGELTLVYILNTNIKDAQGKVVKKDADIATFAPTTSTYKKDDNTVTWVEKSLNELDFTIALVATSTLADEEPVIYGALPVKIVVPELVDFTTKKVDAIPYLNGDNYTTGNIVKALVVNDAVKLNGKNPYALYNTQAANLTELFWPYKTVKEDNVTKRVNYAPAEDECGYAIYNQKVAIDMEGVSAYLENTKTALTKDVDYTISADGTVTLTLDTANIKENIIVKVPVNLTHDYQGGHKHQVVAELKFTK